MTYRKFITRKEPTLLRNENETKRNETKRNEIQRNEKKYIKQSIKDQ